MILTSERKICLHAYICVYVFTTLRKQIRVIAVLIMERMYPMDELLKNNKKPEFVAFCLTSGSSSSMTVEECSPYTIHQNSSIVSRRGIWVAINLSLFLELCNTILTLVTHVLETVQTYAVL